MVDYWCEIYWDNFDMLPGVWDYYCDPYHNKELFASNMDAHYNPWF